MAVAKGQRISSDAFTLQVLPRDPALGASRVGFTVTRKLGNAVARNRIRRRLREAVRLATAAEPALLPAATDLVLVARAPAASLPFAALCAAVAQALRRAARPRPCTTTAHDGAGSG